MCLNICELQFRTHDANICFKKKRLLYFPYCFHCFLLMVVKFVVWLQISHLTVLCCYHGLSGFRTLKGKDQQKPPLVGHLVHRHSLTSFQYLHLSPGQKPPSLLILKENNKKCHRLFFTAAGFCTERRRRPKNQSSTCALFTV